MSRMVRFSVCALLAAALAAQTPVLRKGVSVQMPITMNAVPMPDADLADSLVVAVTFRGAVFLEAATMTPAQLSGKVKEQLAGRPGKRVYLKGDARTPYATVAEVLHALQTPGVNTPILLTSQHAPTTTTYQPPIGLEVLNSASQLISDDRLLTRAAPLLSRDREGADAQILMTLCLVPPPAPDAAQSVTLKAGNGQVSDAELKQHTRQGRLVVLQAESTTPFGDVVHAVDVCRAEGAKVFLATPAE